MQSVFLRRRSKVTGFLLLVVLRNAAVGPPPGKTGVAVDTKAGACRQRQAVIVCS